ncbi:uncharacterized protein TNCT_523641 [Trichonephila clavata]|uniref:Peptidase aspartic putative domain-containing protein n=1 Tax=Trichonephila clavata TaxID=2740835 RepID=A0A8X6KW51_TRICU|nr:uncharacterized protein TNCT_523641 [Trichonephila clavata]
MKCLICGRRHYVLLCPDLRKENPSSPKDKGFNEEENSTEALSINIPAEQEVYLKTIIIRLRHKGKEICVRALLDDGSHRSYVEKDLVEELKLCPSGKETFSKGLFGGEIPPAAEHGKYTVTVESLDLKYSTKMSLLDQQKVCSMLPRIRDESLLADLASRETKLTDVGKDTPPIGVLLGADVLGSLLIGRIEVFTSGVSAVETLLGWTILGHGRKKHVVNMVTLNLYSIEPPRIRDIETNELYCVGPQVDMLDSEVVKKRKLLSVFNSTYDPEVSVPSPPAPNPMAEVSRPVKETHCDRRIVSRQRIDCCKY